MAQPKSQFKDQPKQSESRQSDAQLSPDRVIPLARIVRRHGFPKAGVLTLKADLFNPGGTLFRGLREIFVSPQLESAKFQKITLAQDPAPHGGSFGQATGVLLKFSEAEAPAIPAYVGLPRSKLPTLERGFYVCDLMGLAVLDENSVVVGHVVAFADLAPQGGGSINLTVETPEGKRFDFPSAWISDESKEQKGLPTELKVPGVRDWIEE